MTLNESISSPKKVETSKRLQTSVQKLLEQCHSDRTLDSRIHNSSINFILKGFPVTHLPELSATSRAIISSVTSNWVFISWTSSFTYAPPLAFLCSHHNHIMRTVTNRDLPVPQPFARSNTCAVVISILSPNPTLLHTVFSSCFSSELQRRWEEGRPPLPKHPLSKEG